jgi:hypothetical protein
MLVKIANLSITKGNTTYVGQAADNYMKEMVNKMAKRRAGLAVGAAASVVGGTAGAMALRHHFNKKKDK